MSWREKGGGRYASWDLLSPELDHATAGHVVGLVEDVTGSLASVAVSDELGDERVVQLAAESFVPFWRRWRHPCVDCRGRDKPGTRKTKTDSETKKGK